MGTAHESDIRLPNDERTPLGKNNTSLQQFFIQLNKMRPTLVSVHGEITAWILRVFHQMTPVHSLRLSTDLLHDIFLLGSHMLAAPQVGQTPWPPGNASQR